MCLSTIDEICAIPSYKIRVRWKCFFVSSKGLPLFPYRSLAGDMFVGLSMRERMGHVVLDHWLISTGALYLHASGNDERSYPLGFHTFLTGIAAQRWVEETTSFKSQPVVVPVCVLGIKVWGTQGWGATASPKSCSVDVVDWMMLKSEDWEKYSASNTPSQEAATGQ